LPQQEQEQQEEWWYEISSWPKNCVCM